MNGLTKAYARELGPEIRVNAILPGAIETAMLDSVGGVDAMHHMTVISPLRRAGTGSEIGKVALFLCTDESSFMTGQLIRVDGGVDVYMNGRGFFLNTMDINNSTWKERLFSCTKWMGTYESSVPTPSTARFYYPTWIMG
jgi:hypothetical protein